MLRHIAFIMDGNRRWAHKKGLQPWYGHQEGIQTIYRVINFGLEHSIEYVSLYAFAIQNFKRSPIEINYIFSAIQKYTERITTFLVDRQVNITFVGDWSLFPKSLATLFKQLQEKTAHFDTLHVAILFCYGAQEEIVDTVKRIVKCVQNNSITTQDITPTFFKSLLWTYPFPDPDLIVRTGGQQRLSNFLLFQSAYSELYFLNDLWPDIDIVHLNQAITYYHECKRNFGI